MNTVQETLYNQFNNEFRQMVPQFGSFNENYQSSYKRICFHTPMDDDHQISQFFTFGTQNDNACNQYLKLDADESLEMTNHELSQPTSDFKSEQQNLKSGANKSTESLEFAKGHIEFLSKKKSLLFPFSRKIAKTKKRDCHNRSYYAFIDKRMPGGVKGSAKKYDQKEQMKFEKLSSDEQEVKDVTYESISIMKNSKDAEAKRILSNYYSKYTKNDKKKSDFLDLFVQMA